MTETARLFTAFELMGALRFVIPERLVRVLRQADIPHLDVEHRENLHITFNFLGDVPVEKIDDILGHIHESADHFGDGSYGIQVAHGDIGAFPHVVYDPRGLFLEVEDRSEDGQPSIYDLQSDLDGRLAKTVPSKDGFQYPYKPHITLARVSNIGANPKVGKRALDVARETLKEITDEHGAGSSYVDYTLRRISLLQSIRYAEGDIEYRRLGGSNIVPGAPVPVAVRHEARRFA